MAIEAARHQEHGRAVAAMFGRIAGWYDFLNHALSLGQDMVWRRRLARLARPRPGEVVLDLAAGTLDVSLELLRQYPDIRVAALDFARPMLETGRRRKVRGGLSRRLACVQADGRALPLAEASVGAVTIAFGIRNILPRAQALAEMHRVLRPGGRLCVLEFGTGRQRIWGGLYNVYLQRLLPWAGRLVSGDSRAYGYLAETITAFPTADEFGLELRQAGFADVLWLPLLSGIVYLHVARKAD